jgi:hypothetical protein
MAVAFIEVDEQGNIVHIRRDPAIQITPVVNAVVFFDKDKNQFKTADGKAASHHGYAMQLPIKIDDATFDALMAGGVDTYTWDFTTKKPKKV